MQLVVLLHLSFFHFLIVAILPVPSHAQLDQVLAPVALLVKRACVIGGHLWNAVDAQ